MPKYSIKIEGMDDVIRALQVVKDDATKRKILNPAFRKASEPMVMAARREAPASKHDVRRYSKGKLTAVYPAGSLKDNIKFITSRKYIGGKIDATSQRKASAVPASQTISNKDSHWYTHFVIRGHRTVQGKTRGSKLTRKKDYRGTSQTRENHFFDRAYNAANRTVHNNLEDVFVKVVTKSAKRNGLQVL